MAGTLHYRIDRDVDATDGVDNFGTSGVATAAPPTRSVTLTNLRLAEAINHKYRIRAVANGGAVLATAIATVGGDLAASIGSVSHPVDDSSGNVARAMATAWREMSVVEHVLAVGLPGANQGMGMVKLYRRAPFGGAWTEETQPLSLPQATPGDFFGASVALSPNGLWLAVGAPGDDHATEGSGVNPQPNALARDVEASGAVQVYQYVQGQGWTPYARLKAINAGPGDAFGTAVAISDSGNLLVGAPNEDSVAEPGVYQPSSADAPELGDGPNAQDRGAVYAYGNTSQGYYFDAYVKPLAADASQASMYFGAAIAMDALGQRVAVGAPRASYAGSFAGGVVFYELFWARQMPPFARWSQPQPFGPGADRNSLAGNNPSPASAEYRGLGGALSMSADGNWLAAGYAEKGGWVPGSDVTLPQNAGQVVVYRRQPSGAWARHSSPVAPAPRANDRFGSSVFLVNDNGLKLLVGAPEDGSGHNGLMRTAEIVPEGFVGTPETGAGYYFIGQADPAQPLVLKARLKSPDRIAREWLGRATAMTRNGDQLLLGGAFTDDPRERFAGTLFFGY